MKKYGSIDATFMHASTHQKHHAQSGALCGVHWTFSIHCVYLLTSQSYNKKLRLITAYLLLQVNCDKIMHMRLGECIGQASKLKRKCNFQSILGHKLKRYTVITLIHTRHKQTLSFIEYILVCKHHSIFIHSAYTTRML